MSTSSEKKKVICEFCGKKFDPKRPWQKFCSQKCRWEKFNRDNPRVKKEDPK
jgi:predicted nucleic acid-binding Zn ribbon protein